jgi:PAS domain S-box-containing protein
MSLQKRLVWLFSAFAGFALLATFTTIYAVRLHVADALASVRQTQAEADRVERLRLGAREQLLRFRELLTGARAPDEAYVAERDAYFSELKNVARFIPGASAEELFRLAGDLEVALQTGVQHLQSSDPATAREFVRTRLDGALGPAIDARLRELRSRIDSESADAVDAVVATNNQVLSLALGIAVLGVTLVGAGTVLIRRWILVPIRQLEAAAREFSRGSLTHRVAPQRSDELGALGLALNTMAGNLAAAHEQLRVSEEKYRSLFDHLRDATIICDAHGRVLECQDGETGLPGRIAGNFIGRSLLELRPASAAFDWSSLIGRVLTRGERVRMTDVRLLSASGTDETFIVDLIAFPVPLDNQTAVAIVLRDVTDNRRAEQQLRRTEAMEATVTLARGVAHDFSGLLTSAIGSLTMLSAELVQGRPAELLHRALRACGQAVSLARTLLTFAGGDRGHPETIRLGETVELILESLDERWLEHITLQTHLDPEVAACIDRDQFTEVVLNLVRNASEAMPEGGALHITVAAGRLPTSAAVDGPPTHAILSVTDTGPGISPDVQERLFEPFFTTKKRGHRHGRGLGLAVVYAAVKNAGGFVHAAGDAGPGATFRVWLPLAEAGPREPADAGEEPADLDATA